MDGKEKRSSFTGSLGFVLAAAGSAVGLGNIWRFPYLAAKDGGGLFLLCYLILAVTFGFTLLTTEIAIGRKTRQSPLTAYRKLHPKWGWIGIVACVIPALILPYYSVIGGWVLKYLTTFLLGQSAAAADSSYFSGFITGIGSPILFFVIYLFATAAIVYSGVEKGIEKLSKVLMPILLFLILGISIFALTLTYTEGNVTRTGLEGFLIYIVPNFSDLTLGRLITVLMDAMGQLFYSVSVAMGIMITYGSYVKRETNLVKSVNQIEIFDTVIAFLAGMMIIPAVYTFMGTEGMTTGPSLMFQALPKVFAAMGTVGTVVGIVFFITVTFAALTSSISILEAVVSCAMDKLGMSRKWATVAATALALVMGLAVCLGYNVLYFELPLPNGTVGQVLDVLDYLSNFLLMPVVAIATCLLIGWVVRPKTVIEEVTQGGVRFGRRWLYVVMIKFVTPVLLLLLLLQSLGLLRG